MVLEKEAWRSNLDTRRVQHPTQRVHPTQHHYLKIKDLEVSLLSLSPVQVNYLIHLLQLVLLVHYLLKPPLHVEHSSLLAQGIRVSL